MKRPSKQPAVPAAFTTRHTHPEFSPTWHISGDVDPVTFTMNTEEAYSSKTLATTPLKCRSHTQKYDLLKVNKTLHILTTKRCSIKNSTNFSTIKYVPGSKLLIEISYLKYIMVFSNPSRLILE